MGQARVLIVMGTRPEAIKLAPVMAALARGREIAPMLLVTGQHRALIDSVLAHFDLRPDFDLDLMRPGQDAGDLAARAMLGVGAVLKRARAEMVIVQGDTGSALGGALAGFHANVPVAHIEAGLRTGDLASPFPEEGNRRLIAQISALHFAPTAHARTALRREGVAPHAILVTGNTGIDALLAVDARVRGNARAPGLPNLPPDRALVLVTTHRRENQGAPLMAICDAVIRIARHEACEIVVPVHPNPAVTRVVRSRLGGVAGVHLVAPLAYDAFVWALRRAALVLTDSGAGLRAPAALQRGSGSCGPRPPRHHPQTFPRLRFAALGAGFGNLAVCVLVEGSASTAGSAATIR